jgi:predicted RNase H-like HicB family nuclease
MTAETCGYITLTFKVELDEETSQYIARCPELGISTSARSIDKAFQRIEEASTLYLNALEEAEERERVFAEAGIAIILGEPAAEVEVAARPDREFVTLHTVRLPAPSFA